MYMAVSWLLGNQCNTVASAVIQYANTLLQRNVGGQSLAGKDTRTCRRVLQYCCQLGLIHIGAVHTANLIYYLRMDVISRDNERQMSSGHHTGDVT